MNTKQTTNELQLALDWYQDNKNLALATVIDTWGSAPCPIGSNLLIDDQNNFAGSVSGGCIESAVIYEAKEVINQKSVKVLDYGVSNNDALNLGLACGGEIKVLLQAVDDELITKIKKTVELQLKRVQFASITDLNTGLVEIKQDCQGLVNGIKEELFTLINNPVIKVFIIGGVHITQYLIKFIANLGLEYVIIDPRTAWANEQRFPNSNIINKWSDAALTEIGLDKFSAVVTLTHDPKLDDPALKIALNSDCFYIGALGSTRTHEKRVTRLLEDNISKADIERIHAPVGLSFKAKSASEIALSIITHIVSEYRKLL